MSSRERKLHGEVVVVWWVDAHMYSGPLSPRDISKGKGLPMLSTGLLLSEDENAIRFSQDYYILDVSEKDERVRDVSIIPKPYIKAIRRWKV